MARVLSRGNLIVLILAVSAAAAGGWLQHQSRLTHVPAGVQVANVGDLRPDIALPDVQGQQHRLSEFHGQRVLINFWASWCEPCLKEMPALVAARAKFRDQDVIVLGIAMDERDRVKAFLTAHPVDAPSTSLRLGDVDETLPFSVLLDENGRVIAHHRGPLDNAELARWLSPGIAP